MKRSFGLILLVAAMAAGCATPTTPTTAPSGGGGHGGGGHSPRQQAQAAAAALLAEFVPPKGAHRLAGPPNLPAGLEQRSESSLVSNSMVDQPAYWEAPGDPVSLLSWEQARLTGEQFTLGDLDNGPPSWDREFDLPAAGVLTSRELIVEVAGAGNGKTAIRLDADIAWQASRPPYDVVPRAARVVTISEMPSMMPHAKRPPAPVTITDPAVVGRLAAFVDSLPVSPLNGEVVSCPMNTGGGLQLAFRTRAGGPVVALAQTDEPCDMVEFTVGKHQPLGLDNKSGVDGRILAIASLHWRLQRPA